MDGSSGPGSDSPIADSPRSDGPGSAGPGSAGPGKREGRKSAARPLQDVWLEAARVQKAEVTVFLRNGVKLSGRIVAHDPYMIALEGRGATQALYKSAVATVQSATPLTLHEDGTPPPPSPPARPPRRPAAGARPAPVVERRKLRQPPTRG
jgi:RNA chaperone Hfq